MDVTHLRFTRILTGAISGETSATKLPNIDVSGVVLKAQAGNAGKVYIGNSGVTKPTDSTTDTTTGFELAAGDETPWIPIHNLSALYLICDNAGDDLTYFALPPKENG